MLENSTRNPAVSVCIPTFRGATHIAATIESVLAQTYTDFELIIIDDNSNDHTINIVQKYTDSRIRLFQNFDNLGAQGNWNRCLTEARGKYLKLLPQDDLLSPDCLAKQVAILDKDFAQKIALVFCARMIIDARNRPIMERGYSGRHSGVISAKMLLRHCLRRGTNLIGEPGGVIFRRQLAASVGPFDGSIPYVIDLDYWFRLLLKGDPYYLSEALVSFRVSRGSWSVAIGKKQSTDYRRFILKMSKNPDLTTCYADILLGSMMAKLNNYMRLLFYRFVLN
jgi:glycosyltransferase involved in cell wall biosynthesis